MAVVEIARIGPVTVVESTGLDMPQLKLNTVVIKKWTRHWKTLVATLIAALGACGLGTVFSYPAVAIPDINSQPDGFHLNSMEVALVVSIASIGGLAGGPLGGIFLDRFGRKSTILFTTAPFVFGWLLIVSSPDFYGLCAGRLMTGFSAGIMDVAVPVYISEISASSVRGFMGSCHELSTNIGILYAFAFGTFLPWTWLAEVCMLIPVCMVFGMVFVPESPRWLFKVGRQQECEDNLHWLRGHGENIDQEMNELVENVKAMQQSNVGWKALLKSDVYIPLLTIVGLMFFQQMAGYGAIPQYMVSILDAGGSEWDSNSETAVVGALGVLANLFSALIVDRVGRRTMLLISATIMTFSLAGLATYFTFMELHLVVDANRYSMVAFICIILYNVSVALGYGPIPFYLASELLPLKVRGKAGGLAVSSVWIFTFATSFTFPYAVDAMGFYGVFWITTGFALMSTVFAYFVVPETKGISLEKIEKKVA